MGLFANVLLLPLAPVRGVIWIGEQVLDQATAAVSDPAEIYQQLAELDEARDAGELSEQDHAQAQDRLVAELMRVRAGAVPAP